MRIFQLEGSTADNNFPTQRSVTHGLEVAEALLLIL
jgi:hypothetical protein